MKSSNIKMQNDNVKCKVDFDINSFLILNCSPRCSESEAGHFEL